MSISNRHLLKRVGQALTGFSLLFVSAAAFQNCSGYQVYDIADSETLSSNNCTDCSSAIGLISSTREITLFNSDLASNRVVDIGGYCDAADFYNSVVEYQYDGGAWVSSSAGCDEQGRFHNAIPVPTTTAAQAFALNIRLRVLTSENLVLYSNPLSITLAVYP